MQRIGRIGAVVEPVITPKAKKLIVEVPIYFNQYIPGVDDGSLEVMAVFIDDKAERIVDMADKHTKDNAPTQGKGMMVEVLGKLYTHKYKDREGRLIKQTKMYIYDISYPNMFQQTKNASAPAPKAESPAKPSAQTAVGSHLSARKTDTEASDDPLSTYDKVSLS